LIEKRRDRLVNLQQAARVADWTTFLLAEERARPARLVQYERTGKGLHHAKDSRTKADSTGGLG
jgi:ABC-type phosphate transport system ATPase subunit